MPRSSRIGVTLLLLCGIAATGPATAQERRLNIGIGGAPSSLDPHFFNAGPNISLTQHIFDTLIQRDADTTLSPMLAESWRPISDTVWEFRLRPGVKWHDGRDFTADDVAFTIARVPTVPNSPGSFNGFVRAITRTEVIDPLTIRMHTAAPHPLLPAEIAAIQVISRHVGTNATTDDYNAGRVTMGTGPYRLASYASGDRTEFVRNDAYWRGREAWSRVSYRFIANDGSRTAALLAGDVDLIDQVPSTDLARLRRTPGVTVYERQGLRLIYLVPDFSRVDNPVGVSDNDGRPLPRNPFQDTRVRRALTIAIDRMALTERVMEGTAVPNGQWLPPGIFSYNPEVPVPPYDPEGARRLLAEAGYPAGFRMTLTTPIDRYPNDARTSQAIAQMWTRIGVRTEVQALPWAAYATRAARQEFNMRLVGWGSITAEASYALVNIFGTWDPVRRTGNQSSRYSNPPLDALTTRAVAELDDNRREAMLREGIAMVDRDTAIIPLYQLINYWATRRGFAYEARMDERTTAMGVRPTGP